MTKTYEGMEDDLQAKAEDAHTEDPEEGAAEEEPNPDHEPEGTPPGDGDEEPGEDAPTPILP